MHKAIEAFEQDFAHWGLRLPPDDVAVRRSGVLRQLGWLVFYDFGRDGHDEFLDYYAALRDAADEAATDDWHVRIYASGERITLPTVIDAYVYAREPTRDEVERARRKYEAGLAAAIDLAMAVIGGPDEPPAQPFTATPRHSGPSKSAPRKRESGSRGVDQAPALPADPHAQPRPVSRPSRESEPVSAAGSECPSSASPSSPPSRDDPAPGDAGRPSIRGLEPTGEDVLVSWMLTPLGVPVVNAEKHPPTSAAPAATGSPHGPTAVGGRRQSTGATARDPSIPGVARDHISDADADLLRPWWARRDSRLSIAIVGVAAVLCVAVVSAIISHRPGRGRVPSTAAPVPTASARAAADSTAADDSAALAPAENARSAADSASADSVAALRPAVPLAVPSVAPPAVPMSVPPAVPAAVAAATSQVPGSPDDAVARPVGPMSVPPIRASSGNEPRGVSPTHRASGLPVKPAGAPRTPR